MIYCVEDERNIRELVLYTLQTAKYEAQGFAEGLSFWEAMAQKQPDLILLDIMLPGEDGISILKKLKANLRTQQIPVILVTAKGSEYDKVTGLDCGADDYIAKPFGMMEFLARVRALLRRANIEKMQEESSEHQHGEITLSSKKHEVSVDGKTITLTLKEFHLLEYLIENTGIVLTRDQLLLHVWGYDFDGETRTVDVHIRTLRQKLGSAGREIQTIRGVGYRIGGKV